MARIRSVFPQLFTDEAFALLSMAARVLIIGLWTEADDQGAFEWKPVSIKMRLFPADNLDIPQLLEELVAANMIAKYEHDGRRYGLVRNFRKYQKPKYPKTVHFVPANLRKYAALPDVKADAASMASISEIGDAQGGAIWEAGSIDGGAFPPNGEIGSVDASAYPQNVETGAPMEEGGGRTEEGEERKNKKTKKDYAFEVGVIRLVTKDLEAWRRAFPYLCVEAEMTGLAEWAGRPEIRRKWFHAVAGALAKRNRDAALALARVKEEVARGPEPKRPYSPII